MGSGNYPPILSSITRPPQAYPDPTSPFGAFGYANTTPIKQFFLPQDPPDSFAVRKQC